MEGLLLTLRGDEGASGVGVGAGTLGVEAPGVGKVGGVTGGLLTLLLSQLCLDDATDFLPGRSNSPFNIVQSLSYHSLDAVFQAFNQSFSMYLLAFLIYQVLNHLSFLLNDY